MNNISSKKNHKKKFSLSEKKQNTITSLNEIEYFLRNLKKFKKCINLYNILKK